jgi:hypothetical protein
VTVSGNTAEAEDIAQEPAATVERREGSKFCSKGRGIIDACYLVLEKIRVARNAVKRLKGV